MRDSSKFIFGSLDPANVDNGIRMPKSLRKIVDDSLIAAIAGLLGFLVSQGLGVHETTRTLRLTRDIQMVNLAHHLSDDFEGNDDFRHIRMAVERWEPLYSGWRWPTGSGPTDWRGRFDNDQINRYLNFFEDIGYYVENKGISERITRELFAPYIIEAYENPEIRCYIDGFRTNAAQQEAFTNFGALAKDLESHESKLAAFQRAENKRNCDFKCPYAGQD